MTRGPAPPARASAKDPFDAAPKSPKDSLHSALDLLLETACMDGTEAARDLVPVLEVLDVGWTSFDRALVREQAQLLGLEIGRRRERLRGERARRAAHEIRPDRQRDARA